ncbi:MAG: IS3 family transposase, partial [Thermoplasmata archaeon]
MLIAEIFAEHKGRYGAPRIWVELQRRGYRVGMNRVASIMSG